MKLQISRSAEAAFNGDATRQTGMDAPFAASCINFLRQIIGVPAGVSLYRTYEPLPMPRFGDIITVNYGASLRLTGNS